MTNKEQKEIISPSAFFMGKSDEPDDNIFLQTPKQKFRVQNAAKGIAQMMSKAAELAKAKK